MGTRVNRWPADVYMETTTANIARVITTRWPRPVDRARRSNEKRAYRATKKNWPTNRGRVRSVSRRTVLKPKREPWYWTFSLFGPATRIWKQTRSTVVSTLRRPAVGSVVYRLNIFLAYGSRLWSALNRYFWDPMVAFFVNSAESTSLKS